MRFIVLENLKAIHIIRQAVTLEQTEFKKEEKMAGVVKQAYVVLFELNTELHYFSNNCLT